MRILARSAAVLGAAAAAAAALVPLADPAMAAPVAPATQQAVSPHEYQCFTYQESDYSGDAYCGGSTIVSFRIEVYCTDSVIRYGIWKVSGAGQTSYATCPTNKFYVGATVQIS